MKLVAITIETLTWNLPTLNDPNIIDFNWGTSNSLPTKLYLSFVPPQNSCLVILKYYLENK